MLKGLVFQAESGMEGGDNFPVEPAPDASAPGEQTPVTDAAPAAPTEPTEPPTTETPPAPAQPATTLTPTTPTTPEVPVTAPDHQTQQKLAWYEENYASVLEQQKQYQKQLREYETSSMTEEEKARYEIEVGRKEIETDREQLAQVTYAQQLHQYYNQFVPPNVIKGPTPSDWQHSVLTYQTNMIRQLSSQLQALKDAGQPGPNAPKVTQGAPQGASPKRNVFDMTREERSRLADDAKQGLTTLESYLPVE